MDESTHRMLTGIFTAGALLTGIVAVLSYFERKRNKVLTDEILKMDRELKALEIEKTKAEVVQLYT